MEEKNPFRDISKRIKTISLDGQELKVKPKVKDAEIFMLLKKDLTTEDADKITQVMYNIVRRAYEPNELSDGDIETIITLNYGKLIGEMTILFGFTTREELEKSRKDFTKTIPKQ